MSTLSTAVKALIQEARGALAFGRGHLVVLADRRTTRHLPKMLALALAGEIDSVVVPLAGSREPVADCLAAAIRDARSTSDDADAPAAAARRQHLALMLPDALSVPTSSLRSLHEIASHLGSHRLVLFVDRESVAFPDPVEELATRIGAPLAKVELTIPKLELATPEPARESEAAPRESAGPPDQEPASASGPPRPDEPALANSTRGAPAAGSAAREAEPGDPSPADALPRFADPVVVDGPARPSYRERRRARRRAHALRLVFVASIACGWLAAPAILQHGRVHEAPDTAPGVVGELTAASRPAVSEESGSERPLVAGAVEGPMGPAATGSPTRVVPSSSASAGGPADTAAQPLARVPVVEERAAPPAARRPAAASKPARKRPAAPPPPVLRVNFNAVPWADLEVDGRRIGPTPIGNVALREGSHRVRARFPDGRVVERAIRVDGAHRRFTLR